MNAWKLFRFDKSWRWLRMVAKLHFIYYPFRQVLYKEEVFTVCV